MRRSPQLVIAATLILFVPWIVRSAAVAQEARDEEPNLTDEEAAFVVRTIRVKKKPSAETPAPTTQEAPSARDPLPLPRVRPAVDEPASRPPTTPTNEPPPRRTSPWSSAEGSIDAVYQTPRRLGNEATTRRIETAIAGRPAAVESQAASAPPSELTRKIAVSLSAPLARLRFAAEKSSQGGQALLGDVAAALADEAFAFSRLQRGEVTAPQFEALSQAARSRGGGAMDSPQLHRLSREMARIHVPAPAAGGDFRAQGVKIQLDELALYQLLKKQGLEAGLRAIETLENALIDATSLEQANGLLDSFSEQRQAEFLKTAMKFRRAENLRLVSLKQLVSRLVQYEADWSRRPDDARNVAGLTRIRGFFLQHSPPDVLIVGEAAAGDPKIAVDDFIVGLRAAWKEARVPGCSIDREEANNFIGYSRVMGVPRDSSFAAIMLEADRVMKRLLIGHPEEQLGIAGFDPVRLLFEDDSTERKDDRFWLAPVQPNARFILLGPRGESALYESRVQVLTEELAVGDGAGLGRANRFTQKRVDAFNSAYDQIAERRPVFKQLNGLFDIVWLGTLLRHLEWRHDDLQRLATLPYEPTYVPHSFPSAVVRHERDGEVIGYRGGCRVAVRSGANRMVESANATHAAISRLAALKDRLFVDLGTAELPALVAPAVGDCRAELAFDSGRQALGDKNYPLASDYFTAAIAADPFFAAAYGERAWAKMRLGKKRDGLRDALAAMTIDPGNPEWRALAARLLLETTDDESFAKLRLEPAEQESLANLLMVEVQDNLEHGYFRLANLACSRILSFAPEHAAALRIRSTARRKFGDLDDALQDIDRLIALDPSPDYKALRVVCLLLAGRITEGVDELERIASRIPDHPWVRTLVPQLTLAVRDGDSAIKELVESYLNLPPEILAAYLESLDAERAADPAREVRELDRIVAWHAKLADDERKAAAAEFAARAEHQLLVALARQVAATSVGSDAEPLRQRVATLARRLRTEHPAWTAPLYYHAQARFATGDFEAALQLLDESWVLDKPLDPVLARWLGKEARDYHTLVHFLKVRHFWSHGQLDGCRLALELLSLEERLSPGVRAAANGLRLLIERRAELAFLPAIPDATMSDIAREYEKVLTFWDSDLRVGDGLMLGLFLEAYVTVAARGGRPDEADGAATVLLSRPFGDVEGSLFSPEFARMRGAACRELWRRYLDEMQRDPNLQDAFRQVRGAAGEARESLAALAVQQASAPWRRRARRVGDLALRWAVDETIRLTIAGQQTNFTSGENTLKALATAARQISDTGRPVSLATGPLARRPAANSAAEIQSRIAWAYRGAYTLSQVRTLDETLAWFRDLSPNRAAHYAAPDFSAPGSTWPSLNLQHMTRDYCRWQLRDASTKLASTPGDGRQLWRLALACKHLEKNDEAIRACSRLLEIEPENESALILRAQIYRRKQMYLSALADLRGVARPALAAQALELRAACHLDSGNWDAAVADFFQILSHDPFDSSSRRDLAEALFRLRRYDIALRQINESLRVYDRWPRALALRAQIEYAMGDASAAAADWTRVIERDREYPDACYSRAQALLRLSEQAAGADRRRLLAGARSDLAEALQLGGETWKHRAAAAESLTEIDSKLK